MLDWAGLLLKAVYFYGHLIGLSNFEFNWRTGRVFTAARSTLYAVVANVIIVILLGILITRDINLNVIFGNSNRLHELVIITMTSLRLIGGLTTVLNRWRQRCQMKYLAGKILRLFLARPQVKRMSRWGILIKFLTAGVTDIIQMAITFDAIGRGDSTFFLGMGLQFWMSGILNLAISQHYLVMLFVRAQYQLLNMELKEVIDESIDLSYHPPRKGAFMTRCCHLADRLEDIAKIQSQLQDIVTKLGDVFGIQGLMVYGGYYISSVTTSYLTYSIFKHGPEKFALNYTTTVLMFAWCFFYYWDAILNLFIMLYVQDDHKEMIRLLERRTIFASGLDVRLEESFESLQLQLLRNPLKIEVMQIFSINRDSTSAMFGSFITHSIVLIQYDIQFF
ncbi:putative gustatory receptor 36a [Drosophila serrata]|uniref:putative gustatory receptor 36a n=1 Tax=Drosophila serrata TaxID=7274 RepID=UPI000A1D0136|nr:putative gustatory receptor 36a [Drosophila serrata]